MGGQPPSREVEKGLLQDGLVITHGDRATYFLALRKQSSVCGMPLSKMKERTEERRRGEGWKVEKYGEEGNGEEGRDFKNQSQIVYTKDIVLSSDL